MQTQVPQRSKKDAVPFYRPPFRLRGQTPAEIIKEARAAITTPSPVNIKPVHTSRPFTPNEKERTLFGKIKKYKSRPPSSFSLRHLKGQEPTAGVKLPSIEIVSRRKNFTTYHYSKNLSLDNLTEDYEAEAFEEIKPTDREKLAAWKKAHSCPKEGRLSKVASLNDLSSCFVNGKGYHKINRQDYLEHFEKENSEANQNSYSFYAVGTSGDHTQSEGEDNSFASQNSVMSKGGGDYEVSSVIIKDPLDDNNDNKFEAVSFIGDSDVNSEQEDTKNEVTVTGKKADVKRPAEVNDESDPILEEAARNLKESPIEIKEEKPLEEKNQLGKSVTVAEKSVVTGSKSEYLMSLKTGFKSPEVINFSKNVPQEILELYETVRFYGVDLGKNGKHFFTEEWPTLGYTSNTSEVENLSVTDGGNSSTVTSSSISQENLLEEKPNEAKFKNSESSSEEHKSASLVKSDATEKIREVSKDGEFLMNNKKRYHNTGDKKGDRERAHKMWIYKQETHDDVPQIPVANNAWDIFWKNSYYEERNDKDERSKASGNEEGLQLLVNKIAALVKKGADSRQIYETTSQLYGLLKSDERVLDSKLKKNILRSLYLCVDIENAEVLLSIAKIFLYLKEESSLSVACKIIFKVARFDTNDDLFLREEDILELFLEGIGRASPLDCAESCIYSYGALKFLTLNHYILSKILHLGALDLMVLHLKIINNAFVENGSVGEQTQHALFQLTGALRHVATGEGALPLFLTTNSIAVVCNTLQYFAKDEDIVVNISRTLSLLSTDEVVTQALMQVENILNLLIDLIERYKGNDKILIRLAFCLGNIVEHSDLARVQLSRSDSAVTVLLNVLKLYIDKDLEISLKEDHCPNPDELTAEEVDDVIVKVIRIIANMSMNPIVGSNLSPATKEKKSLQLSKLLSILLMRKDPGITLLATLGCLNNISYYCNSHSVLVDITQGVERVLGLDSVECQTEAARVLGNLTRHKEIRDLIDSTGGVDLLVKLLSSTDQEVVRCACGALVNMLLDSGTRKRFVKAHGIDKLLKILEVFPDEWSLAGLVARAIWNSCGDDVSSAMLHNNVENLLNFLACSLEEENWNDGDVAWEEFASVATDLLEKISLHLEST